MYISNMSRLPPATLLLSAALSTHCKSDPPQASEASQAVQVAAASDLTLAFEELGRLFEARTGRKVTFSFAASGALAKQLTQGAPFDLFAAANASFVDQAVQAGACDGESKARYGRGLLVVWSKTGGVKISALEQLKSNEIRHVAIANPEHAPYGKAAREALSKAGLWPELEGKIVHAENVRQALQFAQTGNADVAIVALSLVINDSAGQRFAVDPRLHQPLEQMLVVCRRGHNAAGGRAFAELVASAEGQRLLERYGLVDGSNEQVGQ
jgi:molybdate transport system substrate-binding protein